MSTALADVDELIRINGGDADEEVRPSGRIDLDADPDGLPPLVEIPPQSGQWYEMQLQSDLSISDGELYRRLTLRIDEEKTQETDMLDDEQVAALRKRLVRLEIMVCQIIVPDADEGALIKLGARRRARLMQRFFEESRLKAQSLRVRRALALTPRRNQLLTLLGSEPIVPSSETIPDLSLASDASSEEPTPSGDESEDEPSKST